jgi:cell division topological specificity factor
MMKLGKLVKLFRKKTATANVAKERLQIIISHERVARSSNSLDLPTLKQELMSVIARYLKIDEQHISVQLERGENCSVLELNITLPNQV